MQNYIECFRSRAFTAMPYVHCPRFDRWQRATVTRPRVTIAFDCMTLLVSRLNERACFLSLDRHLDSLTLLFCDFDAFVDAAQPGHTTTNEQHSITRRIAPLSVIYWRPFDLYSIDSRRDGSISSGSIITVKHSNIISYKVQVLRHGWIRRITVVVSVLALLEIHWQSDQRHRSRAVAFVDVAFIRQVNSSANHAGLVASKQQAVQH